LKKYIFKEESIMLERMKGLLRDEEGQGMAEYGLILALVAVACIVAFVTLGGGIQNKLGQVSDNLD
jgi:pilus assembly protein Flp/PilA